jgi:HK97 gp10 family phage protein
MVKITGREVFRARLQGIASEKTIQNVGTALFAGGQAIEAEAKHMITEGAVSGKHHVEPPKNDSGVLHAHIETTQPAPLKVEVSSNAPYAAALEYGTSKMQPRPYMQPATDRKRKEVVELVRAAVSKAVKG